MSGAARVLEFRPLALHLQGVGPFQETPFSLDFLDRHGEPSNFFILLSRNGRGKTTILEAFSFLANLLESPSAVAAPLPPWLQDHPRFRLQLDLLFWLERGLDRTKVVVSLIADSAVGPLQEWNEERLARFGATTWVRHGFEYGPTGVRRPLEVSSFMEDLHALIAVNREDPLSMFTDGGGSVTAPTVLYFTAQRDLLRPPSPEERKLQAGSTFQYRPFRRLERAGAEWGDSLDNLLVWLWWLDDGKERFPRAQEFINKHVFREPSKVLKGIRKWPLEAVVSNGGYEHRVDQLSSGEKNILQMLVCIKAFQTQRTIVLIDELDLHLHPHWERLALSTMRRLVEETEGLTIIFSTHSKDMLDRFAPELDNPDVRKGGYIIEEGFVGAPAQTEEDRP